VFSSPSTPIHPRPSIHPSSIHPSHVSLISQKHKTQDGLIHKDELSTALFGAPAGGSLLTDRIFSAFDTAANDVIDFPEFVRGLSAFHPAAPLSAKAAFAFRMYDLGRTGAIEPGEVRRLLGGLIRDNPALSLSEADVDALVDAAMADGDAAGDGVIHPHEWAALVARCPAVAGFMTLPALSSLTTKYPSFVLRDRPGA
jgi:serine/threonine-protein phosphatase 2B regulatory subunit